MAFFNHIQENGNHFQVLVWCRMPIKYLNLTPTFMAQTLKWEEYDEEKLQQSAWCWFNAPLQFHQYVKITGTCL
jgi:hypothetical protein